MRYSLLLVLAVFILSACSGDDNKDAISRAAAPMDQRISIMELEKRLEPASAELLGEEMQIAAPWSNAFWPQTGGYPSHAMSHVAFGGEETKLAWSAKIGRGSDKKIPLNASPIVVDGKVFTLDTQNRLSALDVQNGKKLWDINIGIKSEDDHVITGGIAFADGVIYATNGFNQVLALSIENGERFWEAVLEAPSRTAPTIINNRVFVTTIDNRLIALDARDGSFLWDHIGLSESASLIGGASAAATNDIVIPAFSSGEVLALRLENGAVAWADNLAGLKRGGGITSISGINAPAVIENNQVFAISFKGLLAAIDARTGSRLWQRNISGAEMPWVSGNAVFVVSTDGELIALGRDNGIILWVTALGNETKDKAINWMGPVLAGDRLIVVSSDGQIAEVNPADGEVLGIKKTKDQIAFAPIIADGKMFLITRNGTLKVYE